VAAVRGQVPVEGEAALALHLGEGEVAVFQYLVRWQGRLLHLELRIVPDDRSAPQALENAHLNLLQADGNEAIKAAPETFQVLARQANDEVRMHVDARLFAKKPQVVLQVGD
jgi:hypothetical protein